MTNRVSREYKSEKLHDNRDRLGLVNVVFAEVHYLIKQILFASLIPKAVFDADRMR